MRRVYLYVFKGVAGSYPTWLLPKILTREKSIRNDFFALLVFLLKETLSTFCLFFFFSPFIFYLFLASKMSAGAGKNILR